MTSDEAITVVIPTSPLVCHPSTEIIDEIYAQTRKHLPTAPIVILCDGVHPEEEYLHERYDGYTDNLANRFHDWTNVTFEYHRDWMHQSGMLRAFFQKYYVRDPLIFWSEHDIPLTDDYIDWQGITDVLLDPEAKMGAIRFELTGDPQKEVQGVINSHGVLITLTKQFVNWPQVFRTDYLKSFVGSFGNDKTYLECSEHDGFVKDNFDRFRYGIYTPEGDVRRCYHTNGRERGAPGLGKPYIEVNGRRRDIYSTPYQPFKGDK